MNKIPSKGSQRLQSMQREADLKKNIASDSNQLTLAVRAASHETAEEKRVREFVCGEISYEAFTSSSAFLKEKSRGFREKDDERKRNFFKKKV